MLIEFPSILLPPSIRSGSIVDITVKQNHSAEQQAEEQFQALQSNILSRYGLQAPSPPVLRLRNATQTSIVLEWDPIQLATSTLRSLSLYRNGSKAGNIPRPMDMLSTKMSGLALDTEYRFFLVLRTSGGTYTSNTLTVKTHVMENLTGITVTPGVLPPPLRETLESAVERIGAKIADTVRIDTTHFVCAEPRGDAWQKAVEMNIPVVRPEWVEGCEREGKLVGVRAYYLDADPKLRQIGANPSINHQSRDSMAGDTRTPPVRTSSVQQARANQSQTSLPSRGPRSPDKEVGEPGPSVAPTPELQQGEVQRQKDKDLPPDPPRVDEEDEDESEEDGGPEDPEKQRSQAESEEESEEEKENAQRQSSKGRTAEAEAGDEKGEDMEEVAL
ncbi:Chitin synthase, class 5 [Knufia fluminis]|uniref:Chitin synthase, class 5 n=1 Tax=Knufia fluminis TaxID=191047 RepID=A0AAN8EI03_9EURO|nr:Chitin synthase, class 5 [Knufia fluminis]